jgi:hypothetical protein
MTAQVLSAEENTAAASKLRYRSHIRDTGKVNAITVSGPGGLYGCEMLRIPYFLDHRLTDGNEVVSLTRR